MKTIMKALMVAGLLAGMSMLPMPAAAQAQTTSSGTLTVSATVQSSISLVFDSDGSGVGLTGSGSGTATLDFGNVFAYGTLATPNVSRSVNGTTDYSISTPFDVQVIEANPGGSAGYALTAELNSTPGSETWAIDGTPVDNSAAASIGGSTQAYNTDVSHTLSVTVPFTMSAGSISNSINFVATAQ